MFGYVRPVQAELLVKELEFYKATYCGVCRAMKHHTGFWSNSALTYDSVFLALIRMLYVPDKSLRAERKRCVSHPLKRRGMIVENEALVYTARAFAILTHYKLIDDLRDEGLGKRMLAAMARPIFKKGEKLADIAYLSEIVEKKLAEINGIEDSGTDSVDLPAGAFGELLGEVFSYGIEREEDALVLRTLGQYLGRFIYAADAAEDYEADRKKGRYNPYVKAYGGAELNDENRKSIRCGLLLICEQIESSVNLLDFKGRKTIEGIVKNILFLGLVKRIAFLGTDGLEDENKETEN